MKAIVKTKFVALSREFIPGEEVDLPEEQIDLLNEAGLGTILEVVNAGEWPRHKGFGRYELSDGSEVSGKAAAYEAQTKLDAEK
jgi:hypothetical protein